MGGGPGVTTGWLNQPVTPLRGNEARSLPLDKRPVAALGLSAPTARLTDVLRGGAGVDILERPWQMDYPLC